ncbi:MAG: bifunctional metallophosphatase/5'-nucleotidase [Bacteroidales bacterium]|jgi:5'-nucleotidase/UDP-sugar diphosphatase|nr:bifunctional metallophosphatase/5'-nucleotidase [Bacteroidales bacterium]
MRKLLLTLAAICLFGIAASAERKEVHILSVNDMHAKIENMPQLAAIADSLRGLYPDLLIVSAGDNRTGEPLNDLYETPAYPMVVLMNMIGFHATTMGNHEFDAGGKGLGDLMRMSGFSYICANLEPAPAFGVAPRPTQVFDVNGVSVGIVGAVEINERGTPDTHPDNCVGLSFTPVLETVQKYRGLRDECDVVILLSHIGYDADVEISRELPWVDLIIGGHSHTAIDGGEMHNGVMITQVTNRLENATHTTVTVENGKVVGRKAEVINVAGYPKKNKVVEEVVRYFSDNPAFQRVLATLTAPMTSYEELGCMMTDAWRVETGSDVAFTNTGGVRYDTLPAGPFTVSDVLRLDPFNNDTVQLELTGQELKNMLIATHDADIEYGFPKVSGIKCEVIFDKKNPKKIKDLKITMEDGSKFDLKKTYKVATNSYSASIADSPRKDPGRSLNRTTASVIQAYLEHQGKIDYTGACRVFESVSKR